MNAPRYANHVAVTFAARLVSAVLICCILHFTRSILIPIGVAALIAFMLGPVVKRLRKWRLPHGPAVGITVVCFFAILTSIGWLIAGQLGAISSEIPRYQENITSKLKRFHESMRGGTIANLKSTIDTVAEDVKSQDAPAVIAPIPVYIAPTNAVLGFDKFSAMGTLVQPLAALFLIIVLVIVMLLKWADLRGRMVGLINQNLTATTLALDDAGNRIAKYLGTQLLINSCFSVIIWLGLTIIGVPYAALLGLCAGLLRYIPYLGPLAAVALPLVISITTSEGWSQVAAVGGMFAVIYILLSNVIEPWLYGSRLGVSGIGIVLAAVIWTFLWGPAGLVLALPLTVCLVVLGEHVPCLSFLARLLSDKPALPQDMKFAQRLLAGDAVEAADILNERRMENGPSESFDGLILPGLARARNEAALGHLDANAIATINADVVRILSETELTAEDFSSEHIGNVGAQTNSTFAVWSMCPMSDCAAKLLEMRLGGVPCVIQTFPSSSLVSTVAKVISTTEPLPLGLCIIHLDAHDHGRVVACLKRLQTMALGIPILVGRWGHQNLNVSEREEFIKLGATAVMNNPAELRKWLMPRALNVATLLPTQEAGDLPTLPHPLGIN